VEPLSVYSDFRGLLLADYKEAVKSRFSAEKLGKLLDETNEFIASILPTSADAESPYVTQQALNKNTVKSLPAKRP
jgi:hypothetical protein